jgi:DNA-binding IclR family transcriptional regulator
MKLHKTTTHRIAHVLESRGLLRRGLDSNRYRLGLHLYDLGCQALDHVNIRDEARPFMTRIALEVGETVHLAVLDRAEVLYIERVEAQRSLTMGSKVGAQPGLLHRSGKSDSGVFPGYRSGANSRRLPDGSENQNTFTSALALKRELERIRDRGYAIDTQFLRWMAYAVSPRQS